MNYEQQILDWLGEHPALVNVFLVTVAWPLVSALLSLGHAWLEQRAPRLAAALRASGFDAMGLARVVLRAPPPPPAPPTPRTTRPEAGP